MGNHKRIAGKEVKGIRRLGEGDLEWFPRANEGWLETTAEMGRARKWPTATRTRSYRAAVDCSACAQELGNGSALLLSAVSSERETRRNIIQAPGSCQTGHVFVINLPDSQRPVSRTSSPLQFH